MRVFNAATEAIKQGGARRGANMGVLRIDHPDIEAFIRAKEDPKEFLNFNLSVAVTDKFMEIASVGREYNLVNPRTGETVAKRPAREVFDLIVQGAWGTGEPGVIFIDAVNRANPTPHLGAIEATNPCGEQPLLNNEPCNLGSVNLGKMLKRGDGAWSIDYKRLEDTVRLGVRFLDNVIDMCRYPAKEIEAIAKGNRKIGLGVMGFADMLARLKRPYDSPEALKTANEVMGFIKETAWDESRRLASERGPFPNISGSVFDRPGASPVRNATATTIAPTGTLSIIAGCSSGIEPFYSLSYFRLALEDIRLHEVNPVIAEVAEDRGFLSTGLMDYISSGGDIKERPDVPKDVKDAFKTAFDISPEAHINMQAAFQRHTDNAVSKTINLPESSGPDAVKKAYMLAYMLGCKGVTVYRSGTREGQVLSCSDTIYC
jgi:ribonucleoside-diphosphate reductase alpha chain